MTTTIEKYFGQYLKKSRDDSILPQMVSASQAALRSAESREGGVFRGDQLIRKDGQLMWGHRKITTYDPRQAPGKNRHTKATIGDVDEYMQRYCAKHGWELAMPWIVDELRRYPTRLVPVGYFHRSIVYFGEHDMRPSAIGAQYTYMGGQYGGFRLLLPECRKETWPEGAQVALITKA